MMSGILLLLLFGAAPFLPGGGPSSSSSSPRRRTGRAPVRTPERIAVSPSAPRRLPAGGAAARGPGRGLSAGSIASSATDLAAPLTVKISSHFLQRIFLPCSASERL